MKYANRFRIGLNIMYNMYRVPTYYYYSVYIDTKVVTFGKKITKQITKSRLRHTIRAY